MKLDSHKVFSCYKVCTANSEVCHTGSQANALVLEPYPTDNFHIHFDPGFQILNINNIKT